MSKGYESYALINVFAKDDDEALAKLKKAEDKLNRMTGIEAVLDDEVYRNEGDDRQERIR